MSLTLDELLAEVASAPSVTPADQDPRLGASVGPYAIQARIGRGGMGTVYLARDTRLQRDVALKMLHDESPDACRELLREARRAATVSHAAIAQVFDVNEEAPPYIAMELVRGDSLHERLVNRPPSPGESMQILVEVADAVAALHAQGIIHRDLTPRNIALTAEGHIKILDFGIAMPVERSAHPEDPSVLYAGTERYIAPERAQGGAPTTQEDVFSFGVLALDLFPDAAPASVVELLLRCRSPDTAERPSDMNAVALALRDAQQTPKSKRRLLLWASLAVALLVAFAWISAPWSTDTAGAAPEQPGSELNAATALASPAPTRLTFYAEDRSIQHLTGDERAFFVTDTLGVSRYGPDDEGVRLSLPGGFHAASAHATRAGVLVLGESNGEGDAYYVTAGDRFRVPNERYIDNLSVARDGTRVAVAERDAILFGTLDGERRSLLQPGSVRVDIDGVLPDQTVAWSPDERRVLVLTWRGFNDVRLEEVEVATTRRRIVYDSPDLLGRLGTYAFTYINDETVAFSMRELNDASVGIYSLSLSEDDSPRLVTRFPTSIQELHWCPGRGSFRFVSLDPDYKLYRQSMNEGVLEGQPQRMTFSDHEDWVTSYSEDGEEILFSRTSAEGSRAYSVPRASPSSESLLLLESTTESQPTSGTRALRQSSETWLTFRSDGQGQHQLLRIGPGGTQALTQAQDIPGDWRPPPYGAQVRRGGARIFYAIGRDQTLQVFEIVGDELRPRFTADGTFDNWFTFAVSQDGERFLYREPEGLVLTDGEGKALRRFPSQGNFVLQTADFLRDGSLIVSASSTRGFTLQHLDTESGELTEVASSYHRWFGAVSASPVRDEFAYTAVGWDTDVFEFTPAL